MDAGGEPIAVPFAEYEQRHEGKLQRRRKKGWSCSPGWISEFFVVSTEYLVSFSSHTSRRVESCIFLGAVTDVLPCPSRREPATFAVRYAENLGSSPCDATCEVMLRAGDAAEMQSWVDAINTAWERRRRSHFFVPLIPARECVAEVEGRAAELGEKLQATTSRALELENCCAKAQQEAAAEAARLAQVVQELGEMREASESNHAKVRDKLTRASAAWMFSTFISQQTSTLQGVFSQWQDANHCLTPSGQLSCEPPPCEQLSCEQAAAVGALAAQLSGLRRASRARALGTWRSQAAGCRGRHMRIAAAGARSEWACRQSSRRTLKETFARLRPAPVPEAPLRLLAALHRSFAKHRLSSAFHSLRLHAATDASDTDRQCCTESQTDSTTCSSVATQASGPESCSAFVQTDGPAVEWLAEISGSPSDSSHSDLALSARNGSPSVGSSSNLPYIGDTAAKPVVETELKPADTSPRKPEASADSCSSPSSVNALSASGICDERGADAVGRSLVDLVNETSPRCQSFISPSSLQFVHASAACARDGVNQLAEDSEEKPSLCIGKLDFSQLERQLDRAASVVSSVRSGLSNLEGRVSRAGSVASSQVPSLHASRNHSRSPSPVQHGGNVSLPEEALQQPAHLLGEEGKEKSAEEAEAAALSEEEVCRQQEWDEKRAFELRWWRTLADVVAGSDTESSPSETVRQGSEPTLHRGQEQRPNQGTGSSFNDVGNVSCSSSGSTDSDIDADIRLAKALPEAPLSDASCWNLPCKGNLILDLDVFSGMRPRSLSFGCSGIPDGIGIRTDHGNPTPVFQKGGDAGGATLSPEAATSLFVPGRSGGATHADSPELRSLAHPNSFCRTPDCKGKWIQEHLSHNDRNSQHLEWLASRALPTPPSSCSSSGFASTSGHRGLQGRSPLLSSLPAFPSAPSGIRTGIGIGAGTFIGNSRGASSSPSLSLSPLPTCPVSTSA